MKVLFIHGIGFHEATSQLNTWIPAWLTAITSAARDHSGIELDISSPFGPDGSPSGLDGDRSLDPGILYYEKLIRASKDPGGLDYTKAISGLLASGITTTVGGWFSRDRGFLDDLPELQWKAREVAAWTVDDTLRANLRKRVAEEIRAKKPDIVVAHSYGTLITYDTCLFEDPDLLAGMHFITLGSQIGNPLLRKEFNDCQISVRCRHWYNLYNPHDRVFVASLDHIRASNFTQILTPHNVGAGHDGATYLGHPAFATQAWPRIVKDLRTPATRALDRGIPELPQSAGGKVRIGNRALLVGIDRYSNPGIPTLHGCVNDTFQLSAALQEVGMDHRQIRMLHNERATRDNFINHLRWLLDDAQPGDHRFLSFSGHGHRRPVYTENGDPLEMHEILCTHDYDASDASSGLRDADFQSLYANLPYNVHFTIFLDCCHSGGITRAGGPAIRSFSGPADMEHEFSKWNSDLEMWEQAPFLAGKGLNPEFLPAGYHSAELGRLWEKIRKVRNAPALAEKELTQEFHQHEKALYYGQYGDTRRIGRATALRDVSHTQYDSAAARLRKLHPETFNPANPASSAMGPYLPLVFMACGETEKASEYIHGAVSYGAFTYALTLILRDIKLGIESNISYGELLVKTAEKLNTLGYTQTPDILGNPTQLNTPAFFPTKKPVAKKAAARKTAKKSARKRA